METELKDCSEMEAERRRNKAVQVKSCQDTRLLGFSLSDVSTLKPLWPACSPQDLNPTSFSGTGGYLGNSKCSLTLQHTLIEQIQ